MTGKLFRCILIDSHVRDQRGTAPERGSESTVSVCDVHTPYSESKRSMVPTGRPAIEPPAAITVFCTRHAARFMRACTSVLRALMR